MKFFIHLSPSMLHFRSLNLILPTFIFHPASYTLRPVASILHPPSSILYSSFITTKNLNPSSFILLPPSSILHPIYSTFNQHPPSYILHPRSFIIYPLNSILHSTSNILHPQSFTPLSYPTCCTLHPAPSNLVSYIQHLPFSTYTQHTLSSIH